MTSLSPADAADNVSKCGTQINSYSNNNKGTGIAPKVPWQRNNVEVGAERVDSGVVPRAVAGGDVHRAGLGPVLHRSRKGLEAAKEVLDERLWSSLVRGVSGIL